MIKQIVYIALIINVLSSCVTSSVFVNVHRPADITINKGIQNVVVVNRSRPSKNNLVENIFEGLISGEGIGADRKGAEYCVEGLAGMLNNSERFLLQNEGGIELKGTGTSSFPIPLAWNEVKSICGSYDCDALLVLETFDSDSRVLFGPPVARTRKVKGIKVKELRYPATLIMELESGWRIYDVNKEKIIDENKYVEIKEFNAWGSSTEQAQLNLPSKSIAIKQAGINAGEKYGFRISPIWLKVNRTYYIGKHEDLKDARQYVKSGDWATAIEIWLPLTEDEDLKIANRAAFNMALASEIKGSLKIAIDWAKKARKAGNKKAYKYINVLSSRLKDEEKLKQQLN
jgi:hypothetical protein